MENEELTIDNVWLRTHNRDEEIEHAAMGLEYLR